ncbi:AAA family ATPase [Acinetobacter baumannii]
MAEIITIASRKGGVGKTTIAINMVVALSNKGKTLLVDADEQQSAMKWNKHRKEKIDAISIHKDLIAELEKLDGEYQYILIDVAGRDSEIFREALLISDKLIVPTQASLLDLDVIPYLNEKVKTAKKTNPNLVSMVVINRASTNAKSNETEQAREFLLLIMRNSSYCKPHCMNENSIEMQFLNQRVFLRWRHLKLKTN